MVNVPGGSCCTERQPPGDPRARQVNRCCAVNPDYFPNTQGRSRLVPGERSVLLSVVHSPRMGRENSEIAEGVPGVDYRLHAIFYRIRDNDIFILRILHHKMEPLVHFSEL